MDYNSSEYYRSEEYKNFMFHLEMLKGNINRMCVTDDPDECARNYTVALKILRDMYDYRSMVLRERKKHEQI